MDDEPESELLGKSNVRLIPTPAGPAISLLDIQAILARLERIERYPYERWEMLRAAVDGLTRIGL